MDVKSFITLAPGMLIIFFNDVTETMYGVFVTGKQLQASLIFVFKLTLDEHHIVRVLL
jgi:hypothetical protein